MRAVRFNVSDAMVPHVGECLPFGFVVEQVVSDDPQVQQWTVSYPGFPDYDEPPLVVPVLTRLPDDSIEWDWNLPETTP